MRITLTLAIVAAAAVFVAADSTRQAGAGVISGRVVDVLSGQAVPNATVVFSSDGGRSQLATAVSDSDGRFVFREVPATALGWLWARMPGYLDGYYGQRFPVLDSRFRPFEFAQGERIEDATINLWKEAVVHGRVLDAAGNATAGVTVTALKEIALGGRLEFAGNRTAKTDNNGEFKIPGLPAGRYAVAAQASSNRNNFSAIGGLGATIFNPAALSASRSTILTLASGDESTVNLRAPRGVRISGAVVGLDEVAVQGRGAMGPGLMLRLVPADSPNPPMGLETARTALRSDGRFQFTGIPAGDYVVRVLQFPDWAHSMPSPLGALLVVVNGRPLPPLPTGPTWWTDVPVTVGTSDLDDLIVPVRKGAGISGTLAFNSAATAIAAEALPEQQLNVMPAEGWSFVSPIQGSIFGNAAGARIEADGHFATVGLPPGRYIFKLSVAQPPRSVTIDGHDAVNGVIEVGNGPVGNVALVMGQFPGQLTGQIQDRSGRLVPDAFVYAFPTDSRRWVDFGPGSFRIQEAAVNRHAEYSISLEPGEYYVVTRTVALPETWMRPEVMRPLIPAAETVLIGEGQKMVRNVFVR